MRLFIAIDLPETVKQELGFRSRELQKLGADLRWTPSTNLHITIQFLGVVEPERLPRVQTTLQETAAGIKPFLVRLESLGASPSLDDPQIIWAGVGDGEKRCTN